MVDRISNLPDSLIERILEGLPQRERVRTSILSIRWRLLWTQLLSLKFDFWFYRSVFAGGERSVSDYLCIINNLLLQCNKNHVLDLSLLIPTCIMKNDLGFDQLIKYSMTNGLQKLCIDGGRYNLPYSFFTCLTVCLTHLKLKHCVFLPPSSFQGFSTLISFELDRCQTTSEAICRFVVGCPTLQNLGLYGLDFPDQTLVVDAPELRYLKVRGKFKWIFLRSADRVEELSIYMAVLPDNWDGLPARSSTLFDSMAKLKKITICNQFCEVFARHGDFLKLANYDGLRSLVFSELRTMDEVVYALNSIKCCPNLTHFTIFPFFRYLTKGEMEYDYNDFSFKCLLTVDLHYIWGSNFWMKLIERLLHSSPTLKFMSLHFNSEEEWVKSVGKVLTYSLTSSTTKIKVSSCEELTLLQGGSVQATKSTVKFE